MMIQGYCARVGVKGLGFGVKRLGSRGLGVYGLGFRGLGFYWRVRGTS